MNKTKVRVLFFCVVAALAVSPLSAFKAVVHNGHIQKLLFGYRALTPDAREKISGINEALYVSIDSTSYNDRMRNALAILRRFGVRDIPLPQTITVPGGPHHQRPTHLGWNFLYSSTDITERWNLRKKLLLDTIDKVFDFSGGERRKADSFGALLYYTHILGDHWGDSLSTLEDRIPLSGRGTDPSVLSELEKHITILFPDDQSVSRTILLLYLRRNKGRVFNISTEKPGPNDIRSREEVDTANAREFIAIQELAEDTLNVLWDEIPRLLQKEAFFTKAFPFP